MYVFFCFVFSLLCFFFTYIFQLYTFQLFRYIILATPVEVEAVIVVAMMGCWYACKEYFFFVLCFLLFSNNKEKQHSNKNINSNKLYDEDKTTFLNQANICMNQNPSNIQDGNIESNSNNLKCNKMFYAVVEGPVFLQVYKGVDKNATGKIRGQDRSFLKFEKILRKK